MDRYEKRLYGLTLPRPSFSSEWLSVLSPRERPLHSDPITCRSGSREPRKTGRGKHTSPRWWCWTDEGKKIKTLTWKGGDKGGGGGWVTWNNSPLFNISPSISIGVFCKYISYKFICPVRTPVRRRENKVQTALMWLWWDQSTDPITPLASKTRRRTTKPHRPLLTYRTAECVESWEQRTREPVLCLNLFIILFKKKKVEFDLYQDYMAKTWEYSLLEQH